MYPGRGYTHNKEATEKIANGLGDFYEVWEQKSQLTKWQAPAYSTA